MTQAMVLRRGVLKLSKAYPEIARFQSLPGYGPIRAATFFAFLDTPWRFRSKAAVWKYVGIGLCRRQRRIGDVACSEPGESCAEKCRAGRGDERRRRRRRVFASA
ncbi:MAG: transposase [Phycisphaerales bacterium]|nr:transposase [Phycisphaerales bacterium]